MFCIIGIGETRGEEMLQQVQFHICKQRCIKPNKPEVHFASKDRKALLVKKFGQVYPTLKLFIKFVRDNDLGKDNIELVLKDYKETMNAAKRSREH